MMRSAMMRSAAAAARLFRCLRAVAVLPALGIALTVGGGTRTAGAEWPERPIRILVPFAPGGITDSIARLSAEWLSPRLGQPVVVENRSGANGAIAAEAVARGAPDGYTLLTASASQMVMLPALTRLPFDPAADFAPVSIVASNPMVLGVSAGLGAASLAEFAASAKERPGQLNYSSGGSGSSNHLAMALLLERAGLRMQHVPYRGGAPAMQALLAGQVAAYFGNPSDMIPHAGGGRVRVLAVAGAERLPALPGVPTVAESGYPGFRAGTWNGIAAPASTPAAVVARIARELVSACADPAFRASIERLGSTPVCNTPDEFRAVMHADASLWREAVRVSGATAE
ncbi:MAG: tripartite tricarboxylate transporter substrate binding protein [Acetobacteraceae bacterium]|nr:tripartite tricarboxylate transporter substrate binding protein [Acetobacteraceae bacterium]